MKKIVLIAVIALFAGSAMFTATSCRSKAKKAADAATELEAQITEEVKELVGDVEVTTGWADNDYTKQVPKPEMAIKASGESGLGYSAAFENATIDQIKVYVAKLKEAGFTVDASETDGEFYIFTASNGNDYSVLVSMAEGESGILISKPISL